MSKSIITAQLTANEVAHYRALIDQVSEFAKSHHLPIILHTHFNSTVTDSDTSQDFKGSSATIMGHLYSLAPTQLAAARLIDEDPSNMVEVLAVVVGAHANQQEHIEEMVASAPHDGAELITYEDGKPIWK